MWSGWGEFSGLGGESSLRLPRLTISARETIHDHADRVGWNGIGLGGAGVEPPGTPRGVSYRTDVPTPL